MADRELNQLVRPDNILGHSLEVSHCLDPTQLPLMVVRLPIRVEEFRIREGMLPRREDTSRQEDEPFEFTLLMNDPIPLVVTSFGVWMSQLLGIWPGKSEGVAILLLLI
jgi:hypothetical protein